MKAFIQRSLIIVLLIPGIILALNGQTERPDIPTAINSQEFDPGTIDLLPALPDEWSEGRFDGVCARGAFELDMKWENSSITEVEILSKAGLSCRINAGEKHKVTSKGKKVSVKTNKDGSLTFNTTIKTD